MKKWLVKTDRHLVEVQEVISGEYLLLDQDGNELMYDDKTNYILEKEFNEESNNYVWYFYPKYFSKAKEDHFVVIGNINLQEMLKYIKQDCDVEILRVIPIKNEI